MSLALRRRSVPPRPLVAGTVITSDSFGGGDVANIRTRALDLALGGSAKTWTQLVGTTNGIGITSGRAVRQATGSARRYNFDAGVGDVYAQLTVVTRPTAISAFLVVRADVSTETFYSVRFSTAAVAIHKHVAGVLTVIGSSVGISDGTTVAIQAVGSTLTLAINGYVANSVIDTDIPNSFTGAGVAVTTAATGFAFDDFLVAAPA